MSASNSSPASENALLLLAAVAGGGLTRADLAALTDYTPGDLDAHLSAAVRAGLVRRMSQWTGNTIYLVENSKRRHDLIATAGTAALANCGAALHEWAEAYRERGWPATTPEYLLNGYFHFLESGNDLARMTALATDPRRHERLLEMTGDATHEVAACQAAIAEQDAPDLAAAFVLAELREWLSPRFNDRLPFSLPATIAKAGDPARAERLASALGPRHRISGLTKLSITLLDAGHLEQARHTIAQLASVVSSGNFGRYSPHPALAAVAELAAAGQWTGAEYIARAITDRVVQADALRSIVSAQIAQGHLDQAEYLALSIHSGDADYQALESVIDALTGSGQHNRADSLARVLPNRAASRGSGGISTVSATVVAAAMAGDDEKLQKIILGTPKQGRDRLIVDAVIAVAQARDFDRAEFLARSTQSNYHGRVALAEIINRLLDDGKRERAIALMYSFEEHGSLEDFIGPHQELFQSADQRLDYILSFRRPARESQWDEHNAGIARKVYLALAYLDAGNLDKAEQIADRDAPLLKLVARLVEQGMIERAEQFADRNGGDADLIAYLGATSAAIGDTVSARRLTGRATMMMRTENHPRRPHRLLLLAEALVKAGEGVQGRRIAEQAVALGGTHDAFISRAAVVFAHVSAASSSESLARNSGSELAHESRVARFTEASDFPRARSVTRDMTATHYKVRALSSIAMAMARAGEHKQAWELVSQALDVTRMATFRGDKSQAFHAIVRALVVIGNLELAEQVARLIPDPEEKDSALQTVAVELKASGRLQQAQRVHPTASAELQAVPTVIKNAASRLKERGAQAVATQLLADADAYATSARIPGRLSPVVTQAGTSDWVPRLLARALCHIGDGWDYLLSDVARIDPAAVRAVADVIAPAVPDAR
jgi:hypothetical protein